MRVSFHINFHTVWGQRLCIVGSVPELGSWEPGLAKEMHYLTDGNWELEIEISTPVQSIEYRYFLSVNDKQIFEEWEKNHQVFFIGNANRYNLYDYWQVRPPHLAFYSSAFTKSLFAHPCNTHERVIKSGKRLTIKIAAPRVEKNQRVAISGNQPCLGNWNPQQALVLSCDTFPVWHIDLDANEIQYPLEYKFLVCDDRQQLLYWEENENRVLNLPPQQIGETHIVSGLYFRDNLPLWHGAGTVIPVFSLRSEKSFGVGDLGDLRLLVDWAKLTRQRIIQVLPMNDTTATYSWTDSYPYSAISVFALHPIYICLHDLEPLSDAQQADFFAQKQIELNQSDVLDYEQVIRHKIAYCRAFFKQTGNDILATPDYQAFFKQNEAWLVPYAAYCYWRDYYHTPDFTQWEEHAVYDPISVRNLCDNEQILFTYFLQYILHKQFKAVSDYARKNGIVLKGDLPIGVSRTSVEAWMEPENFHMNGQAGAPPDDFSVNGQNWQFPTYNWKVMEANNFEWWKKRFRKLADYFDCFRIDHILGFFRIWEIPMEYVQGLCGHFNPAMPLTKEEIEQFGLPFDEARFTTPRIKQEYLHELFGDETENVINTFLAQSSSHHFVLKPFCDTQRKIERLFTSDDVDANLRSESIKSGLFAIANEVLFLRDPYEPEKFHPRISAAQSFLFRELSASEQYAFNQLYWDFFYHRHNDFWKAQAMERLTPLIACTDMLVCGEDLGMIPESVPDVMNRLQILSLEVERMPKTPHQEFTDLSNLPYHSVCTTSTHDMSPLRSWWTEDKAKTQRYFNTILKREGETPIECTAEIASQIVLRHLQANSMLTIIPLQDWLAIDDRLKRPDAEAERINVPADPHHYWRYRMHLSIEQLLQADEWNTRIRELIQSAGR